MAKQEIKYVCEICSKGYETLDEAVKCENQGIFLPEIELGLTLRSNNGRFKGDNSFQIHFSNRPPEGHYGSHAFARVTFNKKGKLYNLEYGIDYGSDRIVSFLKEGYWSFLSEDDLSEAKDLFANMKRVYIQSKNNSLKEKISGSLLDHLGINDVRRSRRLLVNLLFNETRNSWSGNVGELVRYGQELNPAFMVTGEVKNRGLKNLYNFSNFWDV